MIIRNPFFYGGTIQETRLFVGRRQEVESIYGCILSGANCSVVGERKIGKSSLLRYVADPTVEAKNGLDASKYLFVYFDFQGSPGMTQSELWQYLLIDIGGQLKDATLSAQVAALRERSPLTWSHLKPLLAEFKTRGLRLVLVFDEFDSATSNPNLDTTFYGGLRNLSNNYPVNLIIATQRSISELQYAHPDTVTSPFFNIFHRVDIGPFTPAEADELVTGALKDTSITFTAKDRRFLDDVASRHPFFLQMAAYHLFEAYRRNIRVNGEIDYRWILERLRDNSAEHWRYYWDHSDNGERLILATLSLVEHGEIEKYNLAQTFDTRMRERLTDRALVAEKDGRLVIFSALFADWIVSEVSFLVSEKVTDFKQAIAAAKARGFKDAWIDTTERLKRGFAQIDIKAIVKWLLVAKGADSMVDVLGRLLKLLSP